MEPLHARIPDHFDSWRNILTGECRRSSPSAGELECRLRIGPPCAGC
jgi:hypothetical protein